MKLKALVVDDSGIMRKMVMQSLTKTALAEWDFVEAQDGADALAKFDPNLFDIAFVDWNMPNMTGIEFVRQARAKIKQMDGEDVPLVMVTSEKTMGKIQEALDEAGADAFISKPFTVEEMQFKLRKPIQKAELVQVRRSRRQRQQPAPAAASGGGFWNKLMG